MSVRNVTLNGKKFVLVPRKQWDAIARKTKGPKTKPIRMPQPLSDGSYGLEHVRISLANKMISRRKAAGLTQAQLARIARVRVETISRLENALHMPSVRTFDKIARALDRAAKRHAA